MAAATEQVRIIIQRNRASRADAGVTKALRGTAWKRGWFLVAHADRLMPYPDGGFNSSTTAVNGGPLQVPGADGNGGLRLIAKQDGIRYAQQASGAGTAVTSIVVSDTGTTRQIYVSMNLSATAATVARALLAHAEAASLVDVAYTGTGGGIVADIGTGTPESVPFVRPYGWANSEVDVSDESSDVELDPLSILGSVEYGIGRLLTDDTVKTPGPVFLTDNQTVTSNYAALKLPLRCDHLFDDDAYCEVP